MSGPERDRAVAYWLELARGDLSAASCVAVEAQAPPRVAANLAHQAAEKALKAAVASNGEQPPRSHDLVRLSQLASAVLESHVTADDLRSLTDAHGQGPYPDPSAPMYDSAQARELIAIATTVVSEVETAVQGR